MVNVSNIVCKTVGIAGMSAVLYDAFAHGKHHAAVGQAETSADVFERSIAAQRSNSNASYVASSMQKKIADFRMSNPLVPAAGSVKGFVGGFVNSLGDNIIPVGLSTMALATKGFFQKAGAWGLGIYALYVVAKEGLGIGKKTPVDE